MKVATHGELLRIFDTQEFESGFKKRQFVLKVDEYTEVILEVQKEKVDFLNKLNEGDNVEVTFFVNGRHWKDDKWFNTLTCTYIKKAETAAATTETANTEMNDLPF
jgi:uncharacterized protein YciI